MLVELEQTLKKLPHLLGQRDKWDSLVINRRKPYTYRVFSTLPSGLRVCLHKFDPCDTGEAFSHPHPWPGAFIILAGSYKMRLGFSADRFSDPVTNVAEFVLTRFSSYEITNPNTWHSVIPLEPTYTVMVNGEPWDTDTAHTKVRTTKGKDLDKMPENELIQHLIDFRSMIEHYLELNRK